MLREDAPAAVATKIAIRHLSKRFATRHQTITAIDDLSLDIAAGEFFVIVGPSGCGKTTLLRILAGLDTPSEGEISVTRSDEVKPGNSMVFQGESIFPWMTVFENAAYGLRLRRRDSGDGQCGSQSQQQRKSCHDFFLLICFLRLY